MHNAQWEHVNYRGDIPRAISHGCMFVYENKLFVFDINGTEEVQKKEKRSKKTTENQEDSKLSKSQPVLFYVLNLQTFVWTCWRGDDVPQVDDFAFCFDSDRGNLYLFGGYLNGAKSNLIIQIQVNRKFTSILTPDIPANHPNARNVPCQRTGARMVYMPKTGDIYLFGGITATNRTLNDMWCFSTHQERWTVVHQRGDVPEPRCGHTLIMHHEKLFLFGGLKEVT